MEYQTRIDEKFSINTMKFPCNIVIIGPTNTGKTTILKHILLEIIDKKKQDFVYLVTNSKISVDNNNYLNFFYLNHIKYLDTVNYKIELETFLDQVKNHGNNIKKKNWTGKIIIVFDDVGEKIKFSIKNFTQECRHANISCIMLLHHYTHIPPSVRESIKYIFFTALVSVSAKDFLQKKNTKDVDRISNMVSILFIKKKYIYCVYDSLNSHFYYYLIDKHTNLDSTDKVLRYSVSIIKKKIFDK
jgi:GTPase SAR1 family protein